MDFTIHNSNDRNYENAILLPACLYSAGLTKYPKQISL